jgi:hypothetical protein
MQSLTASGHIGRRKFEDMEYIFIAYFRVFPEYEVFKSVVALSPS